MDNQFFHNFSLQWWPNSHSNFDFLLSHFISIIVTFIFSSRVYIDSWLLHLLLFRLESFLFWELWLTSCFIGLSFRCLEHFRCVLLIFVIAIVIQITLHIPSFWFSFLLSFVVLIGFDGWLCSLGFWLHVEAALCKIIY